MICGKGGTYLKTTADKLAKMSHILDMKKILEENFQKIGKLITDFR